MIDLTQFEEPVCGCGLSHKFSEVWQCQRCMATHSMPDISEIIAEVKTLRSQLAVAVEALEKLSCLGNGDIRGNSDGNIIASTAIDTINDKQIGGE